MSSIFPPSWPYGIVEPLRQLRCPEVDCPFTALARESKQEAVPVLVKHLRDRHGLTTPQSEGARQVAEYKVTVSTDPEQGQWVGVEVTGGDIPSDKLAKVLSGAVLAAVEASAVKPETVINVAVNGTTILERDIREAVKRIGRDGDSGCCA